MDRNRENLIIRYRNEKVKTTNSIIIQIHVMLREFYYRILHNGTVTSLFLIIAAGIETILWNHQHFPVLRPSIIQLVARSIIQPITPRPHLDDFSHSLCPHSGGLLITCVKDTCNIDVSFRCIFHVCLAFCSLKQIYTVHKFITTFTWIKRGIICSILYLYTFQCVN